VPQGSRTQEQKTHLVALLACLAVVAVMFFGAILTGIVSLVMEKDHAASGELKSDRP